jgi:hypothetical protein
VGGEYDVEVEAADARGSGGSAPVLIDDILEVGTPGRRAWPGPSTIDHRWSSRLSGWSGRSPGGPTGALLIVIIVGLGIAILVSGRHHPSAVANPHPIPAPTASALDLQQASFAAMVELANSALPLHDFTISDDVHPSCPRGPVGQPDPVKAIVATVLRYQPQYTLLDAARGVDLAGTCSVEVRERSTDGSVLIVIVVAPPNTGVTPLITTKDNDRTDSVDVIVISYGWRVEVGATGQAGEQPSADDIVGLAEDARLVW